MRKIPILVVALWIWAQVGSAEASLMNVNLTAPNFQPFPYATDVHVKLSSSEPIYIFQTYSNNTQSMFSQVPLKPAVVTGNLTTEVRLDWHTFPPSVVFPGGQVHIGFAGSIPPRCHFCDTPGVFITESYWTSGEPIGPLLGLLSPVFIPPSSIGPAPTWLVGRVDLFEEGPELGRIGSIWWEDQAISASFFNFTTVPVLASIAFASFPDMIALENLNESLTGFGPASPVQLFMPVPLPAAVPEPASIVLLGAGLMGLLAARNRSSRKIGERRQLKPIGNPKTPH